MCQCKFIMLVVFTPIFVVDTEIIFGYNFGTSLNNKALHGFEKELHSGMRLIDLYQILTL